LSFFQWYFDILEVTGEAAVKCPFPHTTSSGTEYFESVPSAHVNIDKDVFHCKVCQRGFNEVQFMKEVFGCRSIQARKLKKAFGNNEDQAMWDDFAGMSSTNNLIEQINISEEVRNQLDLVQHINGDILFPVFMYGKLLDIRTYNTERTPKVKSRLDSVAGMIIPFDVWQNTDPGRVTLLCAGEKDMAIARTRGFNAITLTGGENALPVPINYFKDRDIIIVYDNDGPGIKGAIKIAKEIESITNSVKVATGFHSVCTEKGEDIYDFFIKYEKTKGDLIKFLEEAPIFDITLFPELAKELQPVTLHDAGLPDNIKRTQRSKIQVTATAEETFSAPTEIMVEKYKLADKDSANKMNPGQTKEWMLEEHNAKDLLHLIDNSFKEIQILKNKFHLLRVPAKEQAIKFKTYATETIYKCTVTDMFESLKDTVKQAEYLAYSVGVKLESGKKYDIKYRLVPHPYQGRSLVMIIFEASQAADTVDTFKLNDINKERLKVIQDLPGNLTEKIDTLTEKVKGILGYDGNATLIKTLDLAYHTPLEFNFGHFKNVRAYLDTIVVGESRMGKSSTAEALLDTYQLGTITSLAGNSATVAGLIGGSNKVNGSFQTRAGVIPQNHKGLMFFEEFGKCNSNLIRELTDIRSSNEVRITRVSGTLTLPALVRMVALTNTKSSGEIKSIASYPNGIEVITDLIGSAEDIARYDIMLVLADKGHSHVDPFWEPEEPLSDAVYQSRIRWVWSRKPDEIIFDKDVGHYLTNKANELNDLYNSHIKIFGTEAWKKLARLSIAIAGYVVSTSEDYKNIIVKQEHVDYAVDYLVSIYDNDVFKLGSYVRHERKYSAIDEEGVELLQGCYDRACGLLLQLEQVSQSNKSQLTAASGLDYDSYNAIMSKLVSGMFIRYSGNSIMPTERFRLGMAKIKRTNSIRRLGDINVGLSSN